MLRATKKVLGILNKSQKEQLIWIGFLMLVGGIVESISVSLVLPLIQAVMNDNTWNEPWYTQIICRLFGVETQRNYVVLMLIILIIIFIIKDLFLLLEYYIQFSYICKTRFDVQKNLMNSYLHRPYEFFLNANSGEIYRVIAGDTIQTFALLSHIISFYTEIIVAIALGVTIIVISPQIGIGMIVILGAEVIIIAKIVKPILKKLGDKQRGESAKTNKWILQSIHGIKSIKVSNTESFFEQKYAQHAKQMVEADRKNLTIQNLPKLIIEAFTVAAVLCLILVMVLLGGDLKEIVPQLSAFVVAAIRLLPSINRLSNAVNQVPFVEGALDNVINALSNNNEGADAGYSVKCQGVSELNFEKNVLFDSISFRYPESEKNILSQCTFEIRYGDSVGIVGPSGAGKTTAIDLILGLLKPNQGAIRVDGVDIEANMCKWHSKLAYIPQTIFLMDDTIKANVAFGLHRNEIDEEKVWLALKGAQMEEFVKDLPDGLETQVGEQGVRLSGGQRQRIGIARALYNDPEILFFDEATSALDNDTEKAIMESIDSLKGKKTLVIIAHRLTTISNCDKIFRVDNGKVERER